jgi:hypothetical protein
MSIANVMKVLLVATLFVTMCNFMQVQGIYVPPHVPMQEVAPVAEFEVPWWLGGFVAVTNETSGWVLPLTYVSGGKTNTGTTLVIQNRGPFNITLFASAPETIQGLASYLVVADSTVQFLSATDWVVVSATFGDEGTDGSFGYLQAENASVACWLGVGTSNPSNKQCGDLTTTRIFAGNSATTGLEGTALYTRSIQTIANVTSTLAGSDYILLHSTASDAGSYIASISVIATDVSSTTSYTSEGALQGMQAFAVHRGTGSVNTIFGLVAGVVLGSTSSGTITSSIAEYIIPLTGSTSICTITNLIGLVIASPAKTATTTVIDYIGIEVKGVISTNSPTTNNVGIKLALHTTATNNAAVQFSDSTGVTGGGIAWGAFEFYEYRCAANVKCNGGSDRVAGYISAGSVTAPANTVAGAISTTISNPVLQAFGAVTANAASGLLSFTVSTAAVTCATAVVTNTNVVASSFVQLTIQSYTGTDFTNGVPVVSRSNTAGSSAGSFTIKLCNTHATNALSGNLFVAFWVLN